MKICLITPGQPSTNPRLVKEADALVEAGFDVKVICAFWTDWALRTDKNLLASRRWSCTYVGGNPQNARIAYHWSRIRHGIARRLAVRVRGPKVLEAWAACRVLPDLVRAAGKTPADLYIAHNLGALPAAIAGARTHGARVGFDAEDLHSDVTTAGEMTWDDALAAGIEGDCLPQFDYLTAASQGIGEAYHSKYGVPLPTTILNVFPLKQRPREYRRTNPVGPLKLYWFGQTIGGGEGLEDVIAAMGLLDDGVVELHLRGLWAPGYADALSRFTGSAGVNPARIIHHSPEPADEMVRLAAAYDVGLSTYPATSKNTEICLCNKPFTYILAGNAIVATATSGQKPIVDRIRPGA